MRDSDFYPAGAYNDPNAPYNEVRVPERNFEIQATYCLSCNRTVWTDNYMPDYEEETGNVYADTSDTNWLDVFEKNEFTPLELIEELRKYVEQDLSMTGENTSKGRYLKRILDSCDGWSITDTEFEEI